MAYGKIYLNNDLRGWNQNIFWEIKSLGGIAQIAHNVDEVLDMEGSAMYFNLHHNPARLESDMVFVDRVHWFRATVMVIPTLYECWFYNNKIKQYESYPEYFPVSHRISSQDEAFAVLPDMVFPFVSKPNDRAGGTDIKIIYNKKEARQIIKAAYPDSNSICLDDAGCLVWQEYMPDNKCDYRVVVLANRYFWVAKRTVGDRGLVCGSSVKKYGAECYCELNDDIIPIMEYIYGFSNKHHFTRLAADVIFDKNQNPIMTEFAASWGTNIMREGTWFYRKDSGEYVKTDMSGADQFKLMAKLLLEEEFQSVACRQLVARQ